MDQVKIGKFIAQMRKEQNLTQRGLADKFIAQMRKEQNLTQRGLADKLSISDKTVSKWERGVSHS